MSKKLRPKSSGPKYSYRTERPYRLSHVSQLTRKFLRHYTASLSPPPPSALRLPTPPPSPPAANQMNGSVPSPPRSRPPAKKRRHSLGAALETIGVGAAPASTRQDSRRGPSIGAAAATRPQSVPAATVRRATAGSGGPRRATSGTDYPRAAAPINYQGYKQTMDDYSTMPPGYFTNLLSQDPSDIFVGEENMETENEVMESQPLNDLNSQSRPKGRSKNFTEAEDILLISAYLNISKDAIVGRDKKDGRFWDRVEKYFHANKTFESDRNWSSLKHRWSSTIEKDVLIFQGFLASIERKNESGKTSNDKLAEANAMFHEEKGKAFSLFHAWNILKDEPKWAELQGSKEDNANGEGHPNLERPLGRKAEKEKAKAKKRGDDEPDPFIDEVKKMRESREQIERERKERDERFIDLDKRKLDLEQDQHDKMTMTTDTSAMDDQSSTLG